VEILEKQRKSITFPASARQLYASLAVPPKSYCIRLLDFHAPRNSTQQPTVCSLTGALRVACLESSPSFVSLSYVWGPKSSPSHTITCSLESTYEYKLEITKNCYDALCQIRNRFGAVTIWVDSICINQEDEEEKVCQIPLMQDIYSQAESTYIWLGSGNDRSDRAVEFLKRRAASVRRLPLACLAAVGRKKKVQEMFLFELRAWRDVCRKKTFLK
jgi:hypothetical protein